MSDNELNFSEEISIESHNLKPRQGKQKRAALSDQDNAALLSDESSEDQAEDLVLEYTDVFAPSGKIVDSVDFEDGKSTPCSDTEVAGFTGDGRVYEDEIVDATPVVNDAHENESAGQRTEILVQIDDEEYRHENTSSQKESEHESLMNEPSAKSNSVTTDLSNTEISKIVEVLASQSVSDSKNERSASPERTSEHVTKRYRKKKKKSDLDIFKDDSSSFSSDVDDNSTVLNSYRNGIEDAVNGDLEWDDQYMVTQRGKSVEVDKRGTGSSPARRRPKKHGARTSRTPRDRTSYELYSTEGDIPASNHNQETELTETVSTYGESSFTVANDSVNTRSPVYKDSSTESQHYTPDEQKHSSEGTHERRSGSMSKRNRPRSTRQSRRTRHRIYLDDPDVHQYIADHASMLRRYLDERKTGSSKNRLRPISQDELNTDASNPRGRRKKKNSGSHMASLPNVNVSDGKDSSTSSSYLRQAKSLSSVGPYDGHGKRGRNLITRIRHGSESSSSEEDDDDYTNRVIGSEPNDHTASRHRTDKEWDELFDICPECGERHPPDDEFPLDQEICPDCGVPHNPYQHQPSSGSQDPPETQDTLPSIEGPHTKEEVSNGVKYYMKYLGSTQVTTQHPVTKETRMQQAQEAYSRIKVPDEETQPSTDVEVVISMERIKVFDREQKFADVMMDHALRTVCFICDIGNILVLMARRLTADHMASIETLNKGLRLQNLVADKEKRTSKNMCHVFECEEAPKVAKAIGQAFNMAYRQFLKTNGITHENVEETEYCHVLESQRIVGQDLDLLTDTTNARDVVVQKKRGDPVGVMLLESGWGSMLPTVFIAHIQNYSPAARLGGQLSVGDHILACNGASLVGLPLSECNQVLRNTRTSTRVILRVVSCPPVVDVVVSRPDRKYQLGFSVQNGTICSLLRGGIAERGGVRVGHRIIEINGDSVVAKSHQHIVDILANTVGEISMKTMPVAMYRLMVGADQPQHV